MIWEKKGLVFKPSEVPEFGLTHVQCPVALSLGDKIRIFFSSRTERGSSQVLFLDVDAGNPKKILHISNKPVLETGPPGQFDQDGVLQTCIIMVGQDTYMYYGGFSKMVTIPHTCMLGLAISKDMGKSFIKASAGPVLPISRVDPYLIGSADVIFHDGKFHMIYTSGTNWFHIDNKYEQSYSLKYAVSPDGISWTPTGQIAIPQDSAYNADCRPAIFKSGDTFHMYFSTRAVFNYRSRGETAYSFGYATSKDLIHWNRNDKIRGIETSDEGWDSEMVCYPTIVESNGRILMFYNGNDFGKDGIGFAELINY